MTKSEAGNGSPNPSSAGVRSAPVQLATLASYQIPEISC